MTFKCDYIQEEQREDWERLVEEQSGFHQSFAWAKFKRMVGAKSYKIGVFDGGRLRGGCIGLKYKFRDSNFVHIPEGPILDEGSWSELRRALLSIVDEETTHIRIEPRVGELPVELKSDFAAAPYHILPRNTLLVDLRGGIERVREGMKQKGRYNLGLAERKGVKVGMGSLEEFYRVYTKTASRAELKQKSLEYFERMKAALEDRLRVWVARVNGEPAAAMIAVYFGKRVTYFYGASDHELRSYMAPYLLHFEVMQEACLAGFEQYDFWGVAPEGAEGHPWEGITRFKLQFGGKLQDFAGAHDWVFKPDLYESFLKEYEVGD